MAREKQEREVGAVHESLRSDVILKRHGIISIGTESTKDKGERQTEQLGEAEKPEDALSGATQ